MIPPILSIEEREELKKSAEQVLAQAPGRWKFVEGCLSLIAELEIKEAVIAELGHNKLSTRCNAQAIQPSGVYRCTYEAFDGHTEHHFNFFRNLTKEERAKYYPGTPERERGF